MEEQWELLEHTGPLQNTTFHPSSNTLVYSLGTIVILWDINTDSKVNLRCHEGPVSSIVFSPDFEYFLTAESSLQPFICVWRFRNLQQVNAKWLRFKPRKSSCSIQLKFQGKKLIVLENEKEGGYRVSLWDWRAPELTLTQLEELETQATSLGVGVVGSDCFVTAETTCIKLWKIDNPISITKRLHFKNDIETINCNPNLGIILVLLKSGQLLSVNTQGKVISSIHSPEHYLSLFLNSDYVYLGSASGSISLCSTRSLTPWKELPPTHNSGIKSIAVSGRSILAVTFSDSTIQILDMSQGQVVNQSSGHSSQVNAAAWCDRWNFVSCSEEGCLYVWKHAGRGWIMQALEVSGGRGFVSSICTHPVKSLVACGFTRGVVKFFEVGEKASYLHGTQLSNGMVTHLEFIGEYLGVCYDSGEVVLLDKSFERIAITLEEAWSFQGVNQRVAFFETFDTSKSLILGVTMHETQNLQLHILDNSEDLALLENSLIQLEGECTGFRIHQSGRYLIAVCRIGGVFFYEVKTGNCSGVIETDSEPLGCICDPSGLYLAVLLQNEEKLYTRVAIYECGTGKKASELMRSDVVAKPSAVSWSKDGRFIIVGSQNGVLSVWKIPKQLSDNISNILQRLQTHPDFWDKFPINLPKKTLGKVPKKPIPKPKVKAQPETKASAFTDSVVSFVRKPKSLEKSPSTLSCATPIDNPISLSRPSNFYYNSMEVVKSSLKKTKPEVIDIECEEPVYNPASRLYEHSDLASEVELVYEDMDRFP